jgi:hypothetical protein
MSHETIEDPIKPSVAKRNNSKKIRAAYGLWMVWFETLSFRSLVMSKYDTTSKTPMNIKRN